MKTANVMIQRVLFLGKILSYERTLFVKGYPITAEARRHNKNDRSGSARGMKFREAGKPRTRAMQNLGVTVASCLIQVRPWPKEPHLQS